MSKKYTTVAIAYDFDGTLAKGNIQENSFIPKLRMTKDEFWDEVKEITKNNEMDQILSYMFLLIKKAKERNISCKKAVLLRPKILKPSSRTLLPASVA